MRLIWILLKTGSTWFSSILTSHFVTPSVSGSTCSSWPSSFYSSLKVSGELRSRSVSREVLFSSGLIADSSGGRSELLHYGTGLKAYRELWPSSTFLVGLAGVAGVITLVPLVGDLSSTVWFILFSGWTFNLDACWVLVRDYFWNLYLPRILFCFLYLSSSFFFL